MDPAPLMVHGCRTSPGLIMYFLLFYDVVPDYVERRSMLRAEHLALARAAHARGELVLGGAYASPVDGAVLLFQGDSPAVVEAFAASDPYVRHGLVTRWWVREWTVVVGDGRHGQSRHSQEGAGRDQGDRRRRRHG